MRRPGLDRLAAGPAPTRRACAERAGLPRRFRPALPFGFAALLGAVVAVGPLGCAGARPPGELRAAREALAEAQASPAAPDALSELAEAQAALDRAEALFEAGDASAGDAAYVAMRMAERARIAAFYRADAEALASARRRAERARRLLVREAAERAEMQRTLAEEAASRPEARAALRAALVSALEGVGATEDAVEAPAERATRVVAHPRLLFWPAKPSLRPGAREAMERIGEALQAGPPSRVRLVVKSYDGAHGVHPEELARQRAAVLREVLADAGLGLDRIEVEARAAKDPAESEIELRILEDELRGAPFSGGAAARDVAPEVGQGARLGGSRRGSGGDRLPPAHSF